MFLSDNQNGPGIKRLLLGSDIRCAVAFWGDGASSLLTSSDRATPARVICDITLGGTNPNELRALGAPVNPNLRHIPKLHSKIYLSNLGVVVGSANASNNGLGIVAEALYLEAGVHAEPGSEVHDQAARWFESLWARAEQVDDAALQGCISAWDRRSIDQRPPHRAQSPDSLLDRVLVDPSQFRGVGFAFTTGLANRSDRDEAAAALIAEDRGRAVSSLSRVDQKRVRDWHVGDLYTDWSAEEISAWPRRFVAVHRNSRGRIGYWFYERAYEVMVGERGMVFARRPSGLRRQLGFQRASSVMAAADAPRLQKIFDRGKFQDHRLVENGDELLRLCSRIGLLD